MKVLFVSEYFTPFIKGGGEINLFLLAKELVKQGVQVSVITSYFEGLQKYEEIEGIQIHRKLKTGKDPSKLLSNVKRSLIFEKSICEEVKAIAERYDLIHLVGASVGAAKNLSRLKIPLIATVESYPFLCPKGDRIYHGKDPCREVCTFNKFVNCQNKCSEIGKMRNKAYLKYNPFFLTSLFRRYQKLNDALSYCNLTAISKYVKLLLEQHGYQSTIIPNGLDLKKFHIKEKEKKIVYLGSLNRFKGPQLILEAVKGLDYKVEFYGKGPLKKYLEKKIIEYRIEGKVISQVPYDKVPEIYASAAIVVFPSIWPEPFGRISIEAMAAGSLIIGSEVGGIKETIPQGLGIKFRPGDIKELREKIINFKDSPELQVARRNYVKRNYSKEIVVRKLIDFYNQIKVVKTLNAD